MSDRPVSAAPRPTLTGQACECRNCGRLFFRPRAFDRHQTTRRDGRRTVICHDPAIRGLVPRRFSPEGLPIWGRPPLNGSGERSRRSQAKDTARR